MRKIMSVLGAIILGTTILPGGQVAAKRVPRIRRHVYHPPLSASRPPVVSAKAAILVDVKTGTILYEKNAFRQMDPASITKVMTALLVIDKGHFNRTVTISRRADLTGGSSLHIRMNDKYTVEDLLRGLLLRSGNDAAIALAEADAGSVERFVRQMNQKARQLGAYNTSFENPNGLTAPGHYSSAYDLSLIARAALKKPLFRQIVSSPNQTITELRRHRKREISNTNQLLHGFPGADGIKTGTTHAAGKCVAASATRDNRQLMAIILNSHNRWGDASSLLNWGFKYWNDVEVFRKDEVMGSIPITGGQRPSVPVVASRSAWATIPVESRYHVILSLPSSLRAPVARQPVGYATVEAPGDAPITIRLQPQSHVAPVQMHQTFWKRVKGWLRWR